MADIQLADLRQKMATLSTDNKFLSEKVMSLEIQRMTAISKETIIGNRKDNEIAQLQKQIGHFQYIQQAFLATQQQK